MFLIDGFFSKRAVRANQKRTGRKYWGAFALSTGIPSFYGLIFAVARSSLATIIVSVVFGLHQVSKIAQIGPAKPGGEVTQKKF